MSTENRAIAELQKRIEAIDSQIDFEQEAQSRQRAFLNQSIQNERDLQALKADWLTILERVSSDDGVRHDLDDVAREFGVTE